MKQLLKDLYRGAKTTLFIFTVLSIVCCTVRFGDLELLSGAFGLALFIGVIAAFNK